MADHVELWGTFAVDDHVRPRPYVAEALLFDRLVIPTPPAWDEETLKHWPRSWKPRTLRPILQVLGDRAIPLPWDDTRRAVWQKEYDTARGSVFAHRSAEAAMAGPEADYIRSLPDQAAKYLTRGVLRSEIEAADEALVRKIRGLPLPGTARIEAVTAYGSLDRFRTELSEAEETDEQHQDPRDGLLITWDIFVPEDTELSDVALLEKIIKLDERADFVEHRRALQQFRRELVAAEKTPEQVRREIDTRLREYNGILRAQWGLGKLHTALTYVAIGAPLLDFLHPGLGSVSGVGLGLASQSWERWAPKYKTAPRQEAVAVVQDLREAFEF